MGGLTLAPAWRTVISGGQVGRNGGARGQAGYGPGLWIWVWGQQLRSLNCTSLSLAGGMGGHDSEAPDSKTPSRPGLKLVASEEALENHTRVGPGLRGWTHQMVGGEVDFLPQSVWAWGLGGWVWVTSAAGS